MFGVVKEWGKGRSFVEQDKASAVQCRRSSVFSKLLTAFPPLESILISQLYSTAKIASERVVPRLHFEHFRHARRPILAMLGPVIAVAFLVALGRVLGLRISLTDSAAPAGIYRIVTRSIRQTRRARCVPACRPRSHRKVSLAVTFDKAIARAEPSRSRRLLEPFPVTLWKCSPDGFPSTDRCSRDSAVAARDSIGRPLPHVPWGSHQVAPGEVWLFGFNNVRSWDARYFGPVPLSEVRGALKPVLTW